MAANAVRGGPCRVRSGSSRSPGALLRAGKRRAVATRASGEYAAHYEEFVVKTDGPVTGNGIALYDITPQVKGALERSGVTNGVASVISRHTTTALTINECEPRLMDDVRQFLAKLVPANYVSLLLLVVVLASDLALLLAQALFAQRPSGKNDAEELCPPRSRCSQLTSHTPLSLSFSRLVGTPVQGHSRPLCGKVAG